MVNMIGAIDYDAMLTSLRDGLAPLVPRATNEELSIRLLEEIQMDQQRRAAEDAAEQFRRQAARKARKDAAGDEDADADATAARRREAEETAARFQQQANEIMGDAISSSMHVEEPTTLRPFIRWPQSLPDPRLEEALGADAGTVATKAALFAGLEALPPDQAAARCLRLGLLPARCPSAEAARALFEAACFAPDPWLAADAADALLRWCGVGDAALAGEALLLGGILELEDPPPPPSAPALWLPSADALLQALSALGVGGTAAAAAAPSPAPASAAAPPPASGSPRMANLKQLLRLTAALARLSGGQAGRPALGVQGGAAAQQQLVVTLLGLQLDPGVRSSALPALHEAAGGVMAAVGDAEWGRVCAAVAACIAAPLGPSHRSAVLLLQELPGQGTRRVQLQQAAGVALLRNLLGKADTGAPSPAAPAPEEEVERLLTGSGQGRRGHALAALLGGGADRPADYWRVMSVLDAADAVLWAAVEDGNRLERDHRSVKAWFVRWLEGLAPLLGPNIRWHFVKARISELGKHTYAHSGVLAAAGRASGGGGGGECDADDV